MALQFRVEHQKAANGADVEVATLIHDGREFTNLGAVIDEAQGYIACYITRREDGRYDLTNFEGKVIAPVKLVSSYKRWVFGHSRVEMFSWRATYNGKTYSGRNAGPGMLVRLFCRKKEAAS
jgi:hypothetical protein